jgi:hypothetical protein
MPNVHADIDEAKTIDDTVETDAVYRVCKWPWLEEEFFGEEYTDYHKVFIIRHPFWVFSGLNRRMRIGKREKPYVHSIPNYKNTLNRWIETSFSGRSDISTIRYEDLFPNNFQNLRLLFEYTIGEFDDSILQHEGRGDRSSTEIDEVPKDRPSENRITKFRTYQINQKVENMNLPEKLQLHSWQRDQFMFYDDIYMVYPELYEHEEVF